MRSWIGLQVKAAREQPVHRLVEVAPGLAQMPGLVVLFARLEDGLDSFDQGFDTVGPLEPEWNNPGAARVCRQRADGLLDRQRILRWANLDRAPGGLIATGKAQQQSRSQQGDTHLRVDLRRFHDLHQSVGAPRGLPSTPSNKDAIPCAGVSSYSHPRDTPRQGQPQRQTKLS